MLAPDVPEPHVTPLPPKERTVHTKLWSDMFVLGLPVLEKILRPLVVYAFFIVALRLAGKRELAQLRANPAAPES